MSFTDRVKQLFSPDESPDLNDLFQLVYGSTPSQDQLDYLEQLTSPIAEDDPVGVLRAIVNSVDHQTSPTPFLVRFSQQDIEYIPVQNFELAIDKTDMAVSVPIQQGGYEPHLIKFYSETLQPGMVFIDIGANIGYYSMLAAQLVGEDGKVFSFEPNSENCRLIMLSAHRNNFENVTVYPFALGTETGHALFSTHIGSNGGLITDTQESLLRPNCVVSPVVRLEDIIDEKVDMIKIDVEGAEGLVVQGAMKLIEKYRPIVTSEFSLEMLPRVSRISGKDFLAYFETNQYDIFRCDRETHNLLPITDIGSFIDTYGEIIRIEDMVFIPR